MSGRTKFSELTKRFTAEDRKAIEEEKRLPAAISTELSRSGPLSRFYPAAQRLVLDDGVPIILVDFQQFRSRSIPPSNRA